MKERLQKILAEAGIGSRRGCEALIAAGRVSVNGAAVKEMGVRADPETDRISVDGERVRPKRRVYLMLHKPAGYLCTRSDERGRRTVHDLLAGVREPVYTVGRLDADAEGLLLLTNDGAFAHRIMHPGGTIGKTYQVEVRGSLTRKGRRGLQCGIVLDGRRTLPAEILREEAIGDGARVLLRIREGRKRQVKRMLLSVGCPVRRLKRVAIGGLSLGGLPRGAYRRLTQRDMDRIFEDGGRGGGARTGGNG